MKLGSFRGEGRGGRGGRGGGRGGGGRGGSGGRGGGGGGRGGRYFIKPKLYNWSYAEDKDYEKSQKMEEEAPKGEKLTNSI